MARYVIEEEPSDGRYVIEDADVQEAGRSLNRGISSIPRQLGLTARYALEGPAQAAQIFTEPVAGLMRSAGIPTKSVGDLATSLADRIGLPKPETSLERVVGDASRLVSGAGGLAGAAGAASSLPGMAGKVGGLLAANPVQQLSSAAGAGLLGGLSKEAGGSPLVQAGAGVLGGVAGGLLPGALGSIDRAGRSIINRPQPHLQSQNIDLKISNILQESGVDYSKMPESIKKSMRSDVARAMQAGDDLDPKAVQRLADFKMLGMTPTRGTVSLNPVQITQEKNLSKIGANTSDGVLNGLAKVESDNNAKLIQTLNDIGAGRGSPAQAGNTVSQIISGRSEGLRSAEKAAWDAARNSPGYRQPISSKVISDVNQALGDEGLMPFMNPTISRYMEAFQSGQPFTPQDYRNLQSMLSREIAKGSNEGAAASVAAKVLRDADISPVSFGSGGAPVTGGMAAQMREIDSNTSSAIDAVNKARQATRAAYAYEDSNPIVRQVLSGAATSDPERIAKRFVIGGTANEAKTLADEIGSDGLPAVRDALLTHLKDKALSGAADEVGKFSQSAFNKAMRDIGDEKLKLFFSPQELATLKTTGRVASYTQFQPVSSAVNNSNSGALMRAGDLSGKVPIVGPMIAPALKGISVSLQQNAAQSPALGLLAINPNKAPLINSGVAPAFAFGGGLLSQ